jgi:hypothetical protein
MAFLLDVVSALQIYEKYSDRHSFWRKKRLVMQKGNAIKQSIFSWHEAIYPVNHVHVVTYGEKQ